MADYKYIAFHQKGPIAAIILNRPEAMNALSPQLIEELRDAVKIAGKDPEVGVVIVTGAGRCLLYTSPSPRDQRGSRMPSSA